MHIPEPFNEKEKIHIKKIAVPDPLISQISDNTSESTDSENEKQSETSTESNSFSMDGFESSNIEFSTFSPDTEFHFSDQNDDKLYSNSVLSRIHALAMLFSWFGAFPGLSKEAFSRLLYLLHTFILPPGNILPTTYDSAHSIISPFIVSPKEYHCCINDCIVYHKHYEDLTECPKCNSNRYKSNKTPVKRFKYLPLLPRIRRLFSSAITSELLQEHVLIQDSNQYDGVFTIHKSSVWKENYSKTGMYQGDCRSLSFALCTDGMNPFSKDKTNYSMWPITLSILNLPSYIRIRPSSLILVGIIPGKKEPQSLNPYIEILVEELMELPSMLIYDAFKKEMFHPSGNIILYVLDYPGRNKVFKCTGKSVCCL